MLVGGPIGGWLAENYGQHSAAFAAMIASVAIFTVDVLLMEVLDGSVEESEKKTAKPAAGADKSKWAVVLQSPAVLPLIGFFTVLGVGMASYNTMYALKPY
jgi:MFS family permease